MASLEAFGVQSTGILDLEIVLWCHSEFGYISRMSTLEDLLYVYMESSRQRG